MMNPTQHQRIKNLWTCRSNVAFLMLLVRLVYWLYYGYGNSYSEHSERPLVVPRLGSRSVQCAAGF